MRRRIGKTAVMIAVVVSMLLFVCCASEDTSAPDIADKGEGEETVSENGSALLPPEEETEAAQMSEGTDGEETGTAQMPEETGGGEMEEPAEVESEESEDNTLIYYACDDKVWENDLFCTFLEGNAAAYDGEQGEELTWPEYFRSYLEDNYGHLYGMQLAMEDLDGDRSDELMILMLRSRYSCDLYVFHEDAGRLYAWDIVESFYTGWCPWILREGGIFEYLGQGSQLLWRFNEDGEQEYMWTSYYDANSFSGADAKEYIRYEESLRLYEDGECVRELGYALEVLASEDLEEAELVEGNREEFDEVYDELFAALPRELRCLSSPEYEDNVRKIPIWEAPGGQGWVSVENFRQFEYIGEDGTME